MIRLTSRVPGMSAHRKRLMALASRILEGSGRPDAEVSILITDDAHMRDLNARYRGLDSATDVLSFSQEEGRSLGGPSAEVLLGDVVVSAETALSQSQGSGESLDDALARLVAHGVLHLLGYDHEGTAAEARSMRLMERSYLGKPPQGRASRRRTAR